MASTTDLEAWSLIALPTLDASTYTDISADDSTFYAGLFGQDVQSTIDLCYSTTDYYTICEYFGILDYLTNYDGWSMGAFWTFPYYAGLATYESFGACFDNGQCFGAWIQAYYNSSDSSTTYYGMQIYFYSSSIDATSPSVPSSYNQAYYAVGYTPYMHISTDYTTDESTWYYLNNGAEFFRMMPTADYLTNY